MATLEILPAAILSLVVPANVSAALVLLPVSAVRVVLGAGMPEVGAVVEPELLELGVDDVGFGGGNALEAAPDPQPMSQKPMTKIAAAFPRTHKRKLRLLAGGTDAESRY